MNVAIYFLSNTNFHIYNVLVIVREILLSLVRLIVFLYETFVISGHVVNVRFSQVKAILTIQIFRYLLLFPIVWAIIYDCHLTRCVIHNRYIHNLYFLVNNWHRDCSLLVRLSPILNKDFADDVDVVVFIKNVSY